LYEAGLSSALFDNTTADAILVTDTESDHKHAPAGDGERKHNNDCLGCAGSTVSKCLAIPPTREAPGLFFC
ncbi:MAG: hypothetical protein ACHP7C_09470, partial [Lysobacterales bacterium]